MSTIIDLRTPDLRELKVGDGVISRAGRVWSLVEKTGGEESWRDETTGIVWHDREPEEMSHYQAVEKFGDRLPTIEEWIEAEKHGIRDVLPNMNHWFWSASLVPYDSDSARLFHGDDGDTGVDVRGVGDSVRCVTRGAEE